MSSKYLRVIAPVLMVICLSVTGIDAQTKTEFVLNTRNAYYNLTKQGVAEFQCSVTPDWKAMLAYQLKKEVKPDNPALKLLGGVLFWVSVNDAGKIRVTHEVDSPPVSAADLDNFQKAISGVEETVDGFWKSVSIYLLTSAMPRPGVSYDLSEKEGHYELSYKDSGYEVLTNIGKNYAISELKVTSATLSSSAKPKFVTTDVGALLIVGYETEYKVGAGKPSHISAQIKYYDVDGVHLPSELLMQTSSEETGSSEMHLHFSNCQIKRH